MRIPEAWAWRRFGAYTASELQVEIYPAQRSASGRVPIIFCHGFSLIANPAQVIGQSPYWERFGLIAEITGCPVVAADFGGNLWANDTAITLAGTTLRTWLAANIGCRSDKVFMAGESMGTLLAANVAWRNPVACVGLWMRAPIVEMQTFHGANPGGLSASMEAAYTNLAGLVAAYPTHDPSVAANRAILANLGERQRIDYGNEDEFIDPDILVSWQAATGCLAFPHHGDHGGNLYTPAEPVAEWIRSVIDATT